MRAEWDLKDEPEGSCVVKMFSGSGVQLTGSKTYNKLIIIPNTYWCADSCKLHDDEDLTRRTAAAHPGSSSSRLPRSKLFLPDYFASLPPTSLSDLSNNINWRTYIKQHVCEPSMYCYVCRTRCSLASDIWPGVSPRGFFRGSKGSSTTVPLQFFNAVLH